MAMANFYSDDHLARMADEIVGLERRLRTLQQSYFEYGFKNEQAKEFAHQGLSRRLSTLVRCVRNTFTALPPELEGIPTSNALHDAEIQMQAFIISVFGCLDNMAWIWESERSIIQPNGNPLPPEWIGLRPTNRTVWQSLSRGLRDYLDGIAPWFDYLEDYRHALAHRIPLYIPPFAVAPGNENRYRELEAEITKRVIAGEPIGDLRREQNALKFFRPFIVHSWKDPTLMSLHVQMLVDYRTIEAI